MGDDKMKTTGMLLIVFLLWHYATPILHRAKPLLQHVADAKGALIRVVPPVANAKTAAQTKVNKHVACLHAAKISQEFADSLQNVAARLDFDPNWMLRVMQAESGLQHDATNAIGATGLIQFMPRTAIALGTTTQKLANMSAVRQLVYIERFYRPAKGKATSYEQLRLFTFFPAALGKADDFVFESARLPAQVVASRNPQFDTNGDMQITKAEFLNAIR